MSKVEINKEIVFSTAHISKETDDWLRSNSEHGTLCVYDFEYGYRILIHAEKDYYKNEFNKLWSLGFGDLAELMRIARDNECKWLVLDADGPVVDFRPQFEW